mgnify:CR=1 FL=1
MVLSFFLDHRSSHAHCTRSCSLEEGVFFLSLPFCFHVLPHDTWLHLTQGNKLYIVLYSLSFKLWLQSCPQVLDAFNNLSEQSFVAQWWTTFILHTWNTRPPRGPGKVQIFYKTDLRPRLSKLVSMVRSFEQINVLGPSQYWAIKLQWSGINYYLLSFSS